MRRILCLVAVITLSVSVWLARNLKPKLADGGTHAIHCGIVLPRVSRVLYKPFNGPQLDLLRGGLLKHTLPSIKVILGDPSGGCALRWPVEPI